MGKGLIFGSRSCGDWSFLEPYRDWPDMVIAADGGLNCARQAGFQPSIYVGDNDSGGHMEPELTCVPLQPEKDVTDLEAAYDWARDHGFHELIFTGCTGGRLDHHMAAMQLLETAQSQGVHAVLLDGQNRVEFLRPGSYSLADLDYTYFSLIPLDRVLADVTIRNAKYPLEHRDVRRGDSLTVSNEFRGGPVELSFTGGCCFYIQSNP